MEATADVNGAHSRSGVVHLRSLTGMRFLAAFAVFCFHLQGYMFPESFGWNLGGPAVSFFFVLSGFILTFVYRDRLSWKTVPRFLFSRFARLWPLHIVCMLVACVVLGVIPANSWRDANSWFGFGLQLTLLQSWVPGSKWAMEFNAVAWSISTELFFYFIFPVMLLLTGKRVFGWLDAGIILVAIALLVGGQYLVEHQKVPWWANASTFAVTFPPLRLFEFMLGMVTCRWMFARGHFGNSSQLNSKTKSEVKNGQFWKDSIWEVTAIAAIISVSAWSHINHIPSVIMNASWGGQVYSLWYRVAAFSPVFAFAIYVFAVRNGFVGRLLSTRLAVWLGEISFAFYLIHQLVIIALNRYTFSDIQFAAYSFMISLFASGLLFAIIEMPSRKFLVSLFDRKPNATAAWFSMQKGFFNSGWGRLQIVSLLVVAALIALHPDEQATREAVDRVVDATPGEMRNVYFRQEAWLMGFEADKVPRGIRLRLAWLMERTRYRNRFVHICDEQGNILGQAKFSRELFERAKPYEPFVEEIVFGRRQLKGASYLAVGFWSKDLKSAVTDHPMAEYNNSRIRVVDLNQFQ